MTRRRFIIFSLGYVAGFALLRKVESPPGSLHARRSDSNDLDVDLSRLFSDPRNAKVIGNRYLSQYPEKRDRELIIADLGLPSHQLEIFSENSLKRWFRESQQRDFTVGKTVIVENWILSHTEATLCALIALL